MKKIILASAITLAAFAPALSATADDYNRSDETSSTHSRSYYHTQKYDNSQSLSDNLSVTRWDEMRHTERVTLTEALTGNWPNLNATQRADAMPQAKQRWQKMSVESRRDLIMAWQRSHPHDMGPMSESLVDTADQR